MAIAMACIVGVGGRGQGGGLVEGGGGYGCGYGAGDFPDGLPLILEERRAIWECGSPQGWAGMHWKCVVVPAAGGAKWPIATYCCPSLDPFASIGGGAHRPLTTLCPPSPCLAYPFLITQPSFPLIGCAPLEGGVSGVIQKMVGRVWQNGLEPMLSVINAAGEGAGTCRKRRVAGSQAGPLPPPSPAPIHPWGRSIDAVTHQLVDRYLHFLCEVERAQGLLKITDGWGRVCDEEDFGIRSGEIGPENRRQLRVPEMCGRSDTDSAWPTGPTHEGGSWGPVHVPSCVQSARRSGAVGSTRYFSRGATKGPERSRPPQFNARICAPRKKPTKKKRLPDSGMPGPQQRTDAGQYLPSVTGQPSLINRHPTIQSLRLP